MATQVDDDKYNALMLEKEGMAIIPAIINALAGSNIAASCYAYKIRNKSKEKLREKKSRKLHEKPDYGIDNITDVVGLRLITLFKKDMPKMLEDTLSLIKLAPFLDDDPEEILIYTGNTHHDEMTHLLKEKIAHHDGVKNIKVDIKSSREGYSSIHIVTRLDRKLTNVFVRTPNYYLPIEIQIRTVFEDAWGEIDHKYGYVIRSGKDAGEPINNPEFVMGHLRVLKSFTDACVDYADLIHQETQGIQAMANKSKVISVESDEEIISSLKCQGIPQNLLDQYLDARRFREDASNTHKTNGRDATKYLVAADHFRELADEIKATQPQCVDVTGWKLFSYYVRMNEAVCLMSTNINNDVHAASTIYLALEETYPEFPLIKMRLAQSFGKLGHVDQAISKFREAMKLANEIKNQVRDGIWPDHLPKVDYIHMEQLLPKLLGYHLWLKSKSLPKENSIERAGLFKEAYEVTESSMTALANDPGKLTSIHNNLLYYAIGYLSLAQGYDAAFESKLSANIPLHLEHTESGLAQKATDVPSLDTVARAYAYLGKIDKAKEIAHQVLNLCLTDAGAVDAASSLEFSRAAYFIIENGRLGPID